MMMATDPTIDLRSGRYNALAYEDDLKIITHYIPVDPVDPADCEWEFWVGDRGTGVEWDVDVAAETVLRENSAGVEVEKRAVTVTVDTVDFGGANRQWCLYCNELPYMKGRFTTEQVQQRGAGS